jgi:hypothetical protein
MADPAGSPFEDECTLDDLWAYLRLTLSLAEQKARTDLLAVIRSGDLPVRCSGNGNDSIMDPGYWEHLTLGIDQGRLVVRPLRFALDPGEYRYTVSWRTVRKIWPQPEERQEPQPVVQEPQPEERQEPAAPAPQPVVQESQPPAAQEPQPLAALAVAEQSPAEYFYALCQANPKARGEGVTQWAKRLHPLMMDAFDRGLPGKRWAFGNTLRSLYKRN